MSDHMHEANWHQRLDTLEQRFAEVMNFFASSGPLPEHRKAKINEFEEKRDTIRAKLAAKGETQKTSEDARSKSEFERDIENLVDAFERWVEHVEKEFDQAR